MLEDPKPLPENPWKKQKDASVQLLRIKMRSCAFVIVLENLDQWVWSICVKQPIKIFEVEAGWSANFVCSKSSNLNEREQGQGQIKQGQGKP